MVVYRLPCWTFKVTPSVLASVGPVSAYCEVARWIHIFCLSVAARKAVFADQPLRYICLLLGGYATNNQISKFWFFFLRKADGRIRKSICYSVSNCLEVEAVTLSKRRKKNKEKKDRQKESERTQQRKDETKKN